MTNKITEQKTGELLRSHRMQALLMQKQLAKILDTSRNYVSSTETGKRTGSAQYLANFARVMDLDVTERAELLDSVLN